MIKKIGLISFDDIRTGRLSHEVYADYSKWIEAANAAPVVYIPQSDDIILDAFLDLVDGVIFIGEKPVNPFNYGEEPDFKMDIDFKKESAELLLVKRIFEKKTPLMAIRRGLWLVNTAFGGSIAQNSNIKENGENINKEKHHEIYIEKSSDLFELYGDREIVYGDLSPSINRLAKGFRISAKNKSGNIEIIESENDNLFIGIQFHLDYSEGEGSLEKLFKYFIGKII
ncbi:MAG: gamma-glutamyl-gamma-aminobutyrate hydrolase family protein [Tissierellia bacterium]|nr:gamma-glutamyl-gamma-aminobutyrate hydrolase family protein [Tissierellia bacterium]